ncbi:MAG: hypothetical protein ACLQPH_03695 [Acidimicrobiales bacterium]
MKLAVLPTTAAVAPQFIVRSCWTCPSRSWDWRDQLARKNALTTRVREAVTACDVTEVLSKMLNMLAQKKSANATDDKAIAVVNEKVGMRGILVEWCLPCSPDTTTPAMTNKRTAWLRAAMIERRV